MSIVWLSPAFNGQFWFVLTRLGEAQILLPVALLTALALAWSMETRAHAIRWLVLLLMAAFITTLSKVAFIGWGLGCDVLDFTGISGHAMFSAAVIPVLFDVCTGAVRRPLRQLAVVCGCALALCVGISRVVVGAHSVSEIVAGLLLGAAVSAMVLTRLRKSAILLGPLLPTAMTLWMVLMPIHAPVATTHATLTELSLLLSGHSQPYTRPGVQHPPTGLHRQ